MIDDTLGDFCAMFLAVGDFWVVFQCGRLGFMTLEDVQRLFMGDVICWFFEFAKGKGC